MKACITTLFLFAVILFANGQYAFHKQWDKRYGGLSSESIGNAIALKNGAFILVGASNSGANGEKTQDNWDTTNYEPDFWVLKIDSAGNKKWDKRFGGLSSDFASSIHQTTDGGYIIGGQSASDIGGDKTQTYRGYFDYWIVKIDSDGNKQWDKTFGGTNEEHFRNAEQTLDGGYIVGGNSDSQAGGDKTESSRGAGDYWVVKTDAAGNKLWDKRFGGNQNESLSALIAARDGGYLLGGISGSDISGDKSQSNWIANHYNWWIVKIDSAGHKLWDKRFGTVRGEWFRALKQTPDGGYILGGESYGGISGDKTQVNQGNGDYWIVKIDSLGSKLWDKSYGGLEEDELFTLQLTSDGGYLMSGISYSAEPGGDKTEASLSTVQSWVVKTDSFGNKQWDKTMQLTDNDFPANAVQTSDGCYLLGSTTSAEVGGYKTQAAWDSSADYWVIKFCMEPFTGISEQTADTVQLQVYPNPFTTDISISIQKQNLHAATFTITNAAGQTIYQRQETSLSSNYTKMLDLSYLPNGLYFVAVEVDGERTVRQIVKQ